MPFEVTLHIIFAIDLANTIKQFAPESYLFVQFNEYHHESRKIIEFSLLYITFRWAVCEPRNWYFGQICRPKNGNLDFESVAKFLFWCTVFFLSISIKRINYTRMLKFKDNTKSQTHTHTLESAFIVSLDLSFQWIHVKTECFLSLIFFALIPILNEMWRLLVQMEHIDDAADHLTVCKLLTGFQ